MSCDRFRNGICDAWAGRGVVVYCPPARAENVEPGECCHHEPEKGAKKKTTKATSAATPQPTRAQRKLAIRKKKRKR